jgi:selenium metabolism protein YedF
MVMSEILDMRGMACPKPVLETKKALQSHNRITVIVDNRAARDNVSRLAAKSGCQAKVDEKSDGIYIHIEKKDDALITEETEDTNDAEAYITCSEVSLVLLLAADTVGRGDEELGGILMRAFMHTFLEVQPRPDTIIFINNGVKLTVSGSAVLEDIKALADEGTEIMVCGTCLNHFNLTDKIAVGEISNAYTIAETLLQAGKVVRL